MRLFAGRALVAKPQGLGRVRVCARSSVLLLCECLCRAGHESHGQMNLYSALC